MPIRKTPSRKRDIGSILVSQLQALLGTHFMVSMKREKPWASITFSGMRHYLEIGLPVAGLCRNSKEILAGLPAHEFDLPDTFVADLLVRDPRPSDRCIRVEILTIADPAIKPAP